MEVRCSHKGYRQIYLYGESLGVQRRTLLSVNACAAEFI